MPKYEKWDIYWAIVAYDDEPGKKKLRPVIIGYDGLLHNVVLCNKPISKAGI